MKVYSKSPTTHGGMKKAGWPRVRARITRKEKGKTNENKSSRTDQGYAWDCTVNEKNQVRAFCVFYT